MENMFNFRLCKKLIWHFLIKKALLELLEEYRKNELRFLDGCHPKMREEDVTPEQHALAERNAEILAILGEFCLLISYDEEIEDVTIRPIRCVGCDAPITYSEYQQRKNKACASCAVEQESELQRAAHR
jgi:hypothetical protein